ncbi:MAG: hypothetical protein LBB57_05940 [Clostridiales Family XIII bacterium]|jgi:hypothetical protein|nr:hypothetical protein [Clostridiales Family XIII bacterium]
MDTITATTTRGEEIMTDLQFKALMRMFYDHVVAEARAGKDAAQLEEALKQWVKDVAGIVI